MWCSSGAPNVKRRHLSGTSLFVHTSSATVPKPKGLVLGRCTPPLHTKEVYGEKAKTEMLLVHQVPENHLAKVCSSHTLSSMCLVAYATLQGGGFRDETRGCSYG